MYDVITLSETGVSPGDDLDQYGRPLYTIEGYHDHVRCDRGGPRGGGVLAWVSEALVFKRRLDLERADAEILSLQIRCSNNKVLLFVVYRTNKQVNFWDALQECYNKAHTTGFCNIIITGDLNTDTSTINGESLKLFVKNNNLTKHVREPTRVTE